MTQNNLINLYQQIYCFLIFSKFLNFIIIKKKFVYFLIEKWMQVLSFKTLR